MKSNILALSSVIYLFFLNAFYSSCYPFRCEEVVYVNWSQMPFYFKCFMQQLPIILPVYPDPFSELEIASSRFLHVGQMIA